MRPAAGPDAILNDVMGTVDARDAYLALVDRLAGRRVAVVGDVVADEFVYGQVARISREAPVLILEYGSTEILPGGAANAANNVAALGGLVRLAAVVGADDAGRRLLRALPGGVNRTGVLRDPSRRTPVKTRILAGGVHSARQQIVRIDRGARQPVDARQRTAFAARALAAVKSCDAVLVSDYGSGLVTPALVARLRVAARPPGRARGRRSPVLLDTRHRLLSYRGLTLCAPNESELEQALGVEIKDDRRVLERAGRAVLSRTRMGAVLVTRGSGGMALFETGRPTVHIPIFGSDEIADVTGAGDTVMAMVTLAVAAGATFEQAARLANYAGGIVVMKRGTATVSAAELRRAVLADSEAPGRSRG